MTSARVKKLLAVSLAAVLLSAPAAAVGPFGARPAAAQDYDRYSKQQLENLLAPVALYPDPLLAQVLLAATFDEQVEEASDLVRRYRNLDIDNQPWDVSVMAVAHYPSVIHMMADKIDWTVALGQAYVEQPDDVMAAVQFLRWQARRAGNLASGQYHQVIVEREYIEIVPYRPDVIFVPVYDPAWVFFRPAAVITFGVAFPIGVWLIHDVDWGGHRIYYHGWRGDRPWIVHSRSYVRINNVYVNNRFTTVNVNRNVVRRNVNVTNLNRFTTIHRETRFDNVERRNQIRGSAGDIRASRREGVERGQQGEKTLRRGDRDRADLKQKDSSPREPRKRLQASPEKTPDVNADRQKQGHDAKDPRTLRARKGPDGQGQGQQQFDKGGQAAREREPRVQKGQEQGKRKNQEKKHEDKQGR